MGTKIPADRIYHSDKVLAGVPQLLDDFHKLIDDQESGEILKIFQVDKKNVSRDFPNHFFKNVFLILRKILY